MLLEVNQYFREYLLVIDSGELYISMLMFMGVIVTFILTVYITQHSSLSTGDRGAKPLLNPTIL